MSNMTDKGTSIVSGWRLPRRGDEIDIHTPMAIDFENLKEGDRLLVTLMPRGDGTRCTFIKWAKIEGETCMIVKAYGDQYISNQMFQWQQIRTIAVMPEHVWMGFECTVEKGDKYRPAVEKDMELTFSTVRNDGAIVIPTLAELEALGKVPRA